MCPYNPPSSADAMRGDGGKTLQTCVSLRLSNISFLCLSFIRPTETLILPTLAFAFCLNFFFSFSLSFSLSLLPPLFIDPDPPAFALLVEAWPDELAVPVPRILLRRPGRASTPPPRPRRVASGGTRPRNTALVLNSTASLKAMCLDEGADLGVLGRSLSLEWERVDVME
ncbi:hypothetical protein BT69DRAFT_684545 [Atractiella rhizophila]|nr:hypothetical protein BT69DRAFT_684545 [Atractiella rhizophila]